MSRRILWLFAFLLIISAVYSASGEPSEKAQIEEKLSELTGGNVSCKWIDPYYACNVYTYIMAAFTINGEEMVIEDIEAPLTVKRNVPKRTSVPESFQGKESALCQILSLKRGVSCSVQDNHYTLTITEFQAKVQCEGKLCRGEIYILGDNPYINFSLDDTLPLNHNASLRTLRVLSRKGDRTIIEGELRGYGKRVGDFKMRVIAKGLQKNARFKLRYVSKATRKSIEEKIHKKKEAYKNIRILSAVEVKPLNLTVEEANISFEVDPSIVDKIKVFHISDDGSIEEVPFTTKIEDKIAEVIVNVKGFSIYALATVSPLKEESNKIPRQPEVPKPLCGLFALIPIGGAVTLSKKGKHEKV